MQKLLIAVCSCQRDRHFHASRRAVSLVTFAGKSNLVDTRFFVGGPMPPQDLMPDEIWLPVNDSYEYLPEKVAAMCGWMAQRGQYSHILKIDNDTTIYPVALWNSGFQNYDYSGAIVGHEKETEFAASGYILSRRAAQVVAAGGKITGLEDLETGRLVMPYVQRGEFTLLNWLETKDKVIHFFWKHRVTVNLQGPGQVMRVKFQKNENNQSVCYQWPEQRPASK